MGYMVEVTPARSVSFVVWSSGSFRVEISLDFSDAVECRQVRALRSPVLEGFPTLVGRGCACGVFPPLPPPHLSLHWIALHPWRVSGDLVDLEGYLQPDLAFSEAYTSRRG